MSETRARRGRPKGSGIDDRKRLDAIARLIASNPSLKPTTAIRTLGITDPSVIRRLRDKFNALRQDLMHDLRTAANKTPAQASTPSRTPASIAKSRLPQQPAERSRSIAAAVRTAPARVAPITADSAAAPPNPPARKAARATATARPHHTTSDDDAERLPARTALPGEANEFLTSLFSAGVAATNTLMAAHTTWANQFLRSPYMTLALRQQLAFGEWAVGLVPAAFHVPTKTAT